MEWVNISQASDFSMVTLILIQYHNLGEFTQFCALFLLPLELILLLEFVGIYINLKFQGFSYHSWASAHASCFGVVNRIALSSPSVIWNLQILVHCCWGSRFKHLFGWLNRNIRSMIIVALRHKTTEKAENMERRAFSWSGLKRVKVM